MAFLLKNLLQYRNNIAVNVLDDDPTHEKLFSRQDSLRPEFFRQLLDEAIYKNFRREEDDIAPSGIKPSLEKQKIAKLDYMLKDKNVFNGSPENVQYLDSNGQKYMDLQSRKSFGADALKRQIRAIDTIGALIASFGVIITFIINDVYISNDKTTDDVVTILSYSVSISTLALIYCIYWRYSLQHKASKADAISPKNYFWQTRELRWFILEVLINIIHVPPHADAKFYVLVIDKTVQYSLLDFVSVIMTLRTYLPMRLFAQYSEWMQGSAAYACFINECEANTVFALKAAFKERPYIFLCSSMAVMTLVLGLCVRTFERPYYMDYVQNDGEIFNAVKYQDYESVWNVFWLVFVTMSTVGFGDYYPISHFGRAVISLAALYGIFNTSLVVYTLAISSVLDDSETKAYEVIRKIKQKNEVVNTASRVITSFIRIGMLKKRLSFQKTPELESSLAEANRALQKSLLNFRVIQEARKQNFLSVHHQLKEIVEGMKVDIKTIKADLVILEEIGEKLNSIEDYNLRIMRKLNQEYSMILYADKMLDLLANKEYVFEKTLPVIESQAVIAHEKHPSLLADLDKQSTLIELEKEEQPHHYHETNLIKNIRKVKLQVKTKAMENDKVNGIGADGAFVSFEPSTPL